METKTETINHYEVIKKLIGPIEPVGESHTDEKRFENLITLIGLMSSLMDDIQAVSKYKERHEFSIGRAGLFAKGALEGLKRE